MLFAFTQMSQTCSTQPELKFCKCAGINTSYLQRFVRGAYCLCSYMILGEQFTLASFIIKNNTLWYFKMPFLYQSYYFNCDQKDSLMRPAQWFQFCQARQLQWASFVSGKAAVSVGVTHPCQRKRQSHLTSTHSCRKKYWVGTDICLVNQIRELNWSKIGFLGWFLAQF